MSIPLRKLTIIGGGAAGIFCAVTAAQRAPGLEVEVLEKTSKLLAKVKISGGGRCNVTHACFSIPEILKKYPRGNRFLRKGFQQFFTSDTFEWFECRGVQLKTEADGRVFPVSDSSQTIINCLLQEAEKQQVSLKLQCEVKSISRMASGFELRLANGESTHSDFVCVACGGFPKAEQFGWLQALGHTIAEPVPSLFTFNIPENPLQNLPGVSVPEATVRIAGTSLSQSGATLVTHWGLSGPAVLRLSAWGARELQNKKYDFSVTVNWLANQNEQQLRENWQNLRLEFATQKIKNRNPFGLPQRLWEQLLLLSEISLEQRWADLPARQQNKLISLLCSQELKVLGKTTYKDEFVTAGGINLDEINPETMESRIIPNLYFCGEVMDVDGITGGFNFQHAWTSGFVAAQSIVAQL
jgi:predicted Rossmann fold flavoprotein